MHFLSLTGISLARANSGRESTSFVTHAWIFSPGKLGLTPCREHMAVAQVLKSLIAFVEVYDIVVGRRGSEPAMAGGFHERPANEDAGDKQDESAHQKGPPSGR